MALALWQTSLKDGQTSLRFGQTSISPLAKGGGLFKDMGRDALAGERKCCRQPGNAGADDGR